MEKQADGSQREQSMGPALKWVDALHDDADASALFVGIPVRDLNPMRLPTPLRMHRTNDKPHRVGHPASLQRTGAACGLVVCTFTVQAADAVAPRELPLVLASLSLLSMGVAVIAATAALRLWRQRTDLAQQLHDARVAASALSDVLDVWHWRTDRTHRLSWLRPPRGALPADWAVAQPAELLWTQFITAEPAALRARLDAAAPLLDLPARQAQHGDAAAFGSLQAVALKDCDGQFMGYEGTWREAVAALPVGAAPPATAQDTAQDTAHRTVQDEHAAYSYTVSHDLRAPIRVVEGFTKIIKEDYGRLLDRIGNDHLDRVLAAAARMNSMIDALLALSQLSTQPLADQPVNLSQLAGYVADDLRRQWPQRELTLHIEPGLQVQGDPTLLRMVLENLLGNAWKYTGKCREPQVWFERSGAADAKGTSTFCVRDNGAGFDMRFADRLFGVFQRLHSVNDFPGTGIGLASVRRIVRRHGGEVWAQAEVDRGAAFYFSLARR